MGGSSEETNENWFIRTSNAIGRWIDDPVVWFRKTIVEPNRQDYNWYHQKFRRVPTIDECYTDDPICKFEANTQFKRDKLVDNEIVNILRQRWEDCVTYEAPDYKIKCDPLREAYETAAANWFAKYGDLGGYANAEDALAKQKHRMIWERRHGPIGSGMKEPQEAEA